MVPPTPFALRATMPGYAELQRSKDDKKMQEKEMLSELTQQNVSASGVSFLQLINLSSLILYSVMWES
jgi:hypothetical protein